ncbi:MAG: hypothetical protein JWL90_1783 [Chthoniobacteraceae bacterium]|nr:hypothetical protein [Chthoniobacteraceae bacterium]MDB6173334.1 hypothetical protein [Chthoniobacteraceae bacterium]
MKRHIIKLLAILLFTAALGSRAHAQIDVFLKLDGVPGESIDAVHAKEIELMGCSFLVDQSGMNWAGGVATAAKANITPIVLTKRADSASPLLFINNLLGTKTPKAVLTFRKAGAGGHFDFITITLSDVYISKYEFAGSTDGDQPTESVSLSFRTITYRFVPQKPDGSAGTPIERKFDIIANKAL